MALPSATAEAAEEEAAAAEALAPFFAILALVPVSRPGSLKPNGYGRSCLRVLFALSGKEGGSGRRGRKKVAKEAPQRSGPLEGSGGGPLGVRGWDR